MFEVLSLEKTHPNQKVFVMYRDGYHVTVQVPTCFVRQKADGTYYVFGGDLHRFTSVSKAPWYVPIPENPPKFSKEILEKLRQLIGDAPSLLIPYVPLHLRPH